MADEQDFHPESATEDMDAAAAEAQATTPAASDFKMPEGAVDISPNRDGGVMKVILREGVSDEQPVSGEEVFVHYTGTLTNGDKFDSSRDRNEHFSFKLGSGNVIKAWDIGVATMKKGELCQLICRSDYAYGASGSPPKIGPNATLLFEIELFYWKGEDISEERDESILRRVLVKGDGYKTPNDGAQVQVHLVGKYDGKEFENREVKFAVGEGSEHGVIDGIDFAIKKFKKGEKSTLKIKPEQAFGSAGSTAFGVPPNATVEYEVTLKEFEKAKETWEMDNEEKLTQCDIYKEKGTNYFKGGKFKDALKFYKKMVDLLKYEKDLPETLEARKKALLLAAHLNAALCHLKLDEFAKTKDECTSALEVDGKSEKAYFRRGQAHIGTHDWEMAKRDFQNVLNVDPSNKAAKSQLALVDLKIKEEKDRQKKIYGGMFQKFAERDNIRDWMTANLIKLSDDKTECLVLVHPRRLAKHVAAAPVKSEVHPAADGDASVQQ